MIAPRRAFAVLAASQTLSMVGSRMTGVAAGFAVFAATGKAAPLLLFAFFAELPAAIGGSLAGVFVDRHDDRRVAALSDAAQAVASAALAASFLLGFFSPALLYAVGLAQGLGLAFQEPAAGALVARLVPDEKRDRANSILGTAHPLAGLVAPALAGLAYPAIGIAGIVCIDLCTFLVSAACLVSLPPSRRRDTPSAHLDAADPGAAAPRSVGTRRGNISSLFGDLRPALRFLGRERKPLGAFLLLAATANFLLNGPLGLSIPYALTKTGSEGGAGLVLSLEGAGGLAGSLALAARGRSRSRPLSFLLGLAAAGAAMVVLGLSSSVLAIGACLFAAIASLQTWSRLSSIVMAEAPAGMEGRLLALSSQLGLLGATSSFVLVGPFVDAVAEPAALASRLPRPFAGPGAGMGFVLALAGAALAVLAISCALSPALRGLGKARPPEAAR